jgi:hypothetical protein
VRQATAYHRRLAHRAGTGQRPVRRTQSATGQVLLLLHRREPWGPC